MLTGKVVSVKGQIVEVEFMNEKPHIHDVLIATDDPTCKMEVYTSATPNSFFCLALTNVTKLHHGSSVVSSGQPIKVPVGNEMLGRVVDSLGEPQDGQGPINAKESKPIIAQGLTFSNVTIPKEIMETGIKAVDFFT